MYINSPGGVVTAGMAVYDTMQVRHASDTNSVTRASADTLPSHACRCSFRGV